MSERFDNLFTGMKEEEAIMLVLANPSRLTNPVSKYIAATRLGSCTSKESLSALIAAIDLDTDDLYNKITRRKAIEALGRRRDKEALVPLLNSLEGNDDLAIINAVDSIALLGCTLNKVQCLQLRKIFEGNDNQIRANIQAHIRLGISSSVDIIKEFVKSENKLVSGSARAYLAKVHGDNKLLDDLIPQLFHPVAGLRRSAVIDLGDAGDEERLEELIRSPVSMPLRARSVFKIINNPFDHITNGMHNKLLIRLLQDNPNDLYLEKAWISGNDLIDVEKFLRHRDESKQYGAAKSLMTLSKKELVTKIDYLKSNLGTDYVVHYYITLITNLLGISERADIARNSLNETIPQYSKSRVAAAWACLRLNLIDQIDVLKFLSMNSKWDPLKWTCLHVIKKFEGRNG